MQVKIYTLIDIQIENKERTDRHGKQQYRSLEKNIEADSPTYQKAEKKRTKREI